MKKAVFVIGVFRKDPEADSLLTDNDYELLGSIADDAGLDAHIVFAINDARFGGQEKRVRAKHTKEEHERVIREICAHDPEMVFCFGRVALGTILGTGPATLKKYKRRENIIPGVKSPVYVTDSLSHVIVQPGVAKWLRLDVLSAVEGFNEPVPGEHTILTPDMPEWEVMPDEFKQVEEIGFDLETYPATSPWDADARIRMAILSARDRRAHVVQSSGGRLPSWVTDLSSDPNVVKGGSNIAFDYAWMKRFGYEVNNLHDTITAEHVIDCKDPYKDLKHIALRYEPELGDYDRDFEIIRNKRGGWEYCTDEDMFSYAGCDGEASYAAMVQQRNTIKRMGLAQAWSLASALYPVLVDISSEGMCIDLETNLEYDREMTAKLSELTLALQEHLGPINPNSYKQLVKALRATVKGISLREHEWMQIIDGEDEEATTKRAILEREAHKHPVLPILLEWRRWDKSHGTYIKKLREDHLAKHGGGHYIHPRFTLSAETYRLASSFPSAHQIPRKPGEDDSRYLNVKHQFVSRFADGVLIEADVSQAELRVAAQESGDATLLDAVSSGDVHTETARRLLRRDAEDVRKEDRYLAKTINFGVIYGMGAGRLSKLLGMTYHEAEAVIGRYFNVYPQLKQYIDDTYALVQRDLAVTTPFGFRRQFPRPPWGQWKSFDGARIERQGFNTIIQSTAACLTFCALIELHELLKDYQATIIGTVHDSILIDCPAGELEEVVGLTHRTMVRPDTKRFGYELTVPLLVDVGVGPSWGAMEKFELTES